MIGNVIVTGGAGYIGSHVCKKLYRKGYNPITIDNLSRGDKSLIKWGPFFQKDIRDNESLNNIFREYSPIAVIHLAAFSYIEESVKYPWKYYDNNINGALSVIKAMIECKIKNIVHSSTCAVYGLPQKCPIKETENPNPINPYGKTKLFIEQTLEQLKNNNDINAISLRYFNAAGADPDMETGEIHNPETHLIPLSLKACINKDSPIIINGVDYPTRDGTCIRDYIHVSDLANAHIIALEKLLSQNIEPTNINLGTGIGYSIFEIFKSIEELTGYAVPYKIGEKRIGDPHELVADPQLSEEVFSWVPEISDLKNIISTSLSWYSLIS